MFNSRLFGYDKRQVDVEINEMSEKLMVQQLDIEYLRNENVKLKSQLMITQKNDK